MNIPVQIKVLDPRIGSTFEFPAYQSDHAAGLDLMAALDAPLSLWAGQTALIPTGISVFVGDPGYAAMIHPRSGLGHKKGLVLGNLTGVIDADYQGPLMVSAWNRNSDPAAVVEIRPGDRIAQLVFVPIARAKFSVVEEFESMTARGEGGFGSTGVGVAV